MIRGGFMRCLGNLLWVLFGGAIIAMLWFVAGLLLCCTIIGIPAGVQCFKIAGFSLWPFGRTVVPGSSLGSFLLNILWVLLFGWEIAITSAMVGIVWCVTIVGIPMGIQCFKIAWLAFMPFGASIVDDNCV